MTTLHVTTPLGSLAVDLPLAELIGLTVLIWLVFRRGIACAAAASASAAAQASAHADAVASASALVPPPRPPLRPPPNRQPPPQAQAGSRAYRVLAPAHPGAYHAPLAPAPANTTAATGPAGAAAPAAPSPRTPLRRCSSLERVAVEQLSGVSPRSWTQRELPWVHIVAVPAGTCRFACLPPGRSQPRRMHACLPIGLPLHAPRGLQKRTCPRLTSHSCKSRTAGAARAFPRCRPPFGARR